MSERDIIYQEMYSNFNKIENEICGKTKINKSLQNLCVLYINCYLGYKEGKGFDFLHNTSYFDKIIFLKFLSFFRKLKNFEISLAKKIALGGEDMSKNETASKSLSTTITKLKLQCEESLDDYIDVDLDVNKYIDNLFDDIDTNNTIYRLIMMSMDYMDVNKEHINLFNQKMNITENLKKRSAAALTETKAKFYVTLHGTLMLEAPENESELDYDKFLAICSPIKALLTRWGERGKPTVGFAGMEYMWKQVLMYLPTEITKDTLNELFKSTLGRNLERYNFKDIHENDTLQRNVIRIKHYSVDGADTHLFNQDYTMSYKMINSIKEKCLTQPMSESGQEYLNDLPKKIFNNANEIINLNIFLLINNIGFDYLNNNPILYENNKEIEELSYYKKTESLYNDITKSEIDDKENLQTWVRNKNFPLDLFLAPKLYIEDFSLDKDIYALTEININITIGGQSVNFTLQKGDSFICNPYIIQYFIEKFDSKITIRPGYILNNKNDTHFKNNMEEIDIENLETGSNFAMGQTITCPSIGLSCYKVTLAALTNYEILKFCEDGGIDFCELYDTSCQSLGHIVKNPNVDSSSIGSLTCVFSDSTTMSKESVIRATRQNTKDQSITLKSYPRLLSELIYPPKYVPININTNFFLKDKISYENPSQNSLETDLFDSLDSENNDNRKTLSQEPVVNLGGNNTRKYKTRRPRNIKTRRTRRTRKTRRKARNIKTRRITKNIKTKRK